MERLKYRIFLKKSKTQQKSFYTKGFKWFRIHKSHKIRAFSPILLIFELTFHSVAHLVLVDWCYLCRYPNIPCRQLYMASGIMAANLSNILCHDNHMGYQEVIFSSILHLPFNKVNLMKQISNSLCHFYRNSYCVKAHFSNNWHRWFNTNDPYEIRYFAYPFF